MIATWVSAVPCITCWWCGERGAWFATAHTHEQEHEHVRRQGPVVRDVRRAWPVCSPECADMVAQVYECPIYDRRGRELSGWLVEWRTESEARRSA